MISTSLLRLSAPLLRWLPVRVATVLYYRLFNARCVDLPDFFKSARLSFAPQVRMRLRMTDAAHGSMAFLGIYEPELSREIWNLARTQGGTLLDVGANYGYFSLLWCAARPENRVVAVEASPRNLVGLCHNIELNGFGGRIEVLPWAASDMEGEVSFDQGPPEQTGWGGMTRESAEHTVIVPCHRLDQQLCGRSFVVLKIDCEGADSLVIQGAASLLNKRLIQHVFYEENTERMAGLGLVEGAAQSTLEKLGYRVEVLGHSGSNEYHAVSQHCL